jgi:hypothetical protein
VPGAPLQLHPAGAAAFEQAVERGGFDEIISSTLPARLALAPPRLPHRVEALGLLVTVVTGEQSKCPAPRHAEPTTLY